MEFNVWRDGQWVQGIGKIRDNGWARIGDENDAAVSKPGQTGTNYDFLGEPPSRSGDILAVPDDYSTIQAAFDAVSENEQILVAEGSYTEDLDLPDTNGWSLIGDGDVTVHRDSNNFGVRASNPSFGGSASADVTFTLDPGDPYIPVTSTSGFIEGMDVIMGDANQDAHGDGVQTDTSTCFEYHTIDSVDSSNNRLYVEHDGGIIHTYDVNSSDHTVRSVEWTAQDIHIDNITFDGGGAASSRASNTEGMRLRGLRDLWMTDVHVTGYEYSGIDVRMSWYQRYTGCRVTNIEGHRGYGFNLTSGGAILLTDCITDTTHAYGIKFAGGGRGDEDGGTYKCRAQDCEVYDAGSYACDAHAGGQDLTWEDCHIENSMIGRGRSPGMTFRNITCHNATGSQGLFRHTHWSDDHLVENVTVTGNASTTFYVVRISPESWEDQAPLGHLSYKDIEIDINESDSSTQHITFSGSDDRDEWSSNIGYICEEFEAINWNMASTSRGWLESEREFGDSSYTGGGGTDHINDLTVDAPRSD